VRRGECVEIEEETVLDRANPGHVGGLAVVLMTHHDVSGALRPGALSASPTASRYPLGQRGASDSLSRGDFFFFFFITPMARQGPTRCSTRNREIVERARKPVGIWRMHARTPLSVMMNEGERRRTSRKVREQTNVCAIRCRPLGARPASRPAPMWSAPSRRGSPVVTRLRAQGRRSTATAARERYRDAATRAFTASVPT